MEILIYDGPPSVGVTNWVDEKIRPSKGPEALVVSNFVRHRKNQFESHHRERDMLHSTIQAFRERVEEGLDLKKGMIIFDGSPVTLLALEQFRNSTPSRKSVKAIQRHIGTFLERARLVLLIPSPHFSAPRNMKKFNPEDVHKYGDCLVSAYHDVGSSEPTVVEVNRCIYT